MKVFSRHKWYAISRLLIPILVFVVPPTIFYLQYLYTGWGEFSISNFEIAWVIWFLIPAICYCLAAYWVIRNAKWNWVLLTICDDTLVFTDYWMNDGLCKASEIKAIEFYKSGLRVVRCEGSVIYQLISAQWSDWKEIQEAVREFTVSYGIVSK